MHRYSSMTQEAGSTAVYCCTATVVELELLLLSFCRTASQDRVMLDATHTDSSILYIRRLHVFTAIYRNIQQFAHSSLNCCTP